MTKLVVFATLILLLYACSATPEDLSGRRLAEIHCTSCHLLPEPEILTERLWLTEILPKMGARLGQYGVRGREYYLGKAEERRYLAPLFPTTELIDSLDWANLQAYYLNNAPQSLQDGKPALLVDEMDQFTVEPVYDTAAGNEPASTTFIQYSSGEDLIRTGGELGAAGVFRVFDVTNQLVHRQATVSPPSAFDPSSGLLTEIGSLSPSDDPRGKVSVSHDTINNGQNLPHSLSRPVDMIRLDLNLDGEQELIIAEFGNLVGALSSWAVDSTGSLTSGTVLATTPGAIRLRSADMDQDGHNDLLVLFAQGDERLEVWYSRSGKPLRKQLLRFPPSFGSSDFQAKDFDQDGDLDLIVANGDNFDYQPVPKRYHGLRIYANDGSADFKENFFIEVDGAYGVEVDDFDGDGDQDLAVIAYFVPLATRQFTSFLYLEQTDELEFKATGFLKKADQHYMRMTSGDINGDGYTDLLLANFSPYLPNGKGKGRASGPSPVYLKLTNVGK